MWNIIAEAIREAELTAFPADQPEEPPEYQRYRRKRGEFLEARRRLREDLEHGLEVDQDEEADIPLQLSRISLRCKSLRTKMQTERKQRLLEEFRESWKDRELAVLHRMRGRLRGLGRGPRKRLYWTPQRGFTVED